MPKEIIPHRYTIADVRALKPNRVLAFDLGPDALDQNVQDIIDLVQSRWQVQVLTNGLPIPIPEPSPVEVDLRLNEQYRMQMAGISTAALGYWKETEHIHPDYDTPALRDVAHLYAKYEALFKQVHGIETDPKTESKDPTPFTEEAAMFNVETELSRQAYASPDCNIDAIPMETEPTTAVEHELIQAVKGINEDVKHVGIHLEDEPMGDPVGIPPTATSLVGDPAFKALGCRVDEYFERDLSHLINRHSIENNLGMPDFVIAKMICDQLNGIAQAVWRTKDWKR